MVENLLRKENDITHSYEKIPKGLSIIPSYRFIFSFPYIVFFELSMCKKMLIVYKILCNILKKFIQKKPTEIHEMRKQLTLIMISCEYFNSFSFSTNEFPPINVNNIVFF